MRTPTVFEHTYQRTVRVVAPTWGLYRELHSAAGVARFIPHIQSHLSHRNGDDTFQAPLLLMPLNRRLDTDIAVTLVDPPRVLGIRLLVQRLNLDIAGTFELSSCGRAETTLRYAARLSTDHPLLRRLRRHLVDALEEHVSTTTELIARRIPQYNRAQHHFPRVPG